MIKTGQRFSPQFCLPPLLLTATLLLTTAQMALGDGGDESIIQKELSWTTHARRLFGESNHVKEDNIAALRAINGLEKQLKMALDDDKHRHLALDVISALNIEELLPDVLFTAYKDRSGHSYLALNEMTRSSNKRRILDFYKENIQERELSIAAQMAVLDTLGRSKERLPVPFLKKWFTGNHEQRSAGLSYLRRTQDLYPITIRKDLIREALNGATYQIHIQALHDFNGPTIYEWVCSQAQNARIKSACKKMKNLSLNKKGETP